jgi:nucleoside-diphosphate-sugar epimerase
MINVLITGAAGYLGSVITEVILAKGYQVTAVDNLSYGQAHLLHLGHKENFNFIYADCRDKSVMTGLIKDQDVIIPLAAIVGAAACDFNRFATKSTNIDAIKMLSEIRSNSQYIVYPTTNSGYGTKTGDVYCTEETILEPISLYGKTKVEAENHILSLENTTTLRLATVFGLSPRLRLDLLVNDFTYTALKDGYIIIYEKDFKRNYVHIRDVADCFVHCIENSQKMQGKPFNVGLDDANLSKEELAIKIKEYVPSFHIEFSELNNDPDKRNYIVSNKRLREHGFEAKRTLDDGIKELLKGYQMLGRNPFKNV